MIMRILVLWRQGGVEVRKTILDHVFCFEKYDKEDEFFYFDIWKGQSAKDYAWIEPNMFDAVIFHYSALSLRGDDRYWSNFAKIMENIWKDYPAKKVFIPQDDYTFTSRIWDLANAINADVIYTIIRESDYEKVYPKEYIETRIETVFTGYVDEECLNHFKPLAHKHRTVDVVYRARKLPYEFGKLGQLKYELAERFQKELSYTDLVYDINNTQDNVKAILGNSWLDYLASSRITLGSLGGSGFCDYYGKYRDIVRRYTRKKPFATYEETKKACFPELDDNLTGMISPRIFEAALTNTCQILVGDDFQGVMTPNQDYIMIKPDFSNIKDVIEKMYDVNYCQNIANSCYKKVILSHKYTYEVLVKLVIGNLKTSVMEKEKSGAVSKIIEENCIRNNDKVRRKMLNKTRGIRKTMKNILVLKKHFKGRNE